MTSCILSLGGGGWEYMYLYTQDFQKFVNKQINISLIFESKNKQ